MYRNTQSKFEMPLIFSIKVEEQDIWVIDQACSVVLLRVYQAKQKSERGQSSHLNRTCW